jgi:hypothetical protein
VDERATRLVPYSPSEITWAQCRPPAERVPPPVVGDKVWVRHEPWGSVVPGTVIHVQPLDDPWQDNPYLWTNRTDPLTGAFLVTADGEPIAERHPDPWPVVHVAWVGGVDHTQEARLRGSAGWLPLDWENRRRPMPTVLVVPRQGGTG